MQQKNKLHFGKLNDRTANAFEAPCAASTFQYLLPPPHSIKGQETALRAVCGRFKWTAIYTCLVMLLSVLSFTPSQAQGIYSNTSFNEPPGSPLDFDKYGHIMTAIKSSHATLFISASSNRNANSGSAQNGTDVLYLQNSFDSDPLEVVRFTTSDVWQFQSALYNYNELHPIAITDIGNEQFVVTMQVKTSVGQTRILVAKFQANTNQWGGGNILISSKELNIGSDPYNGQSSQFPMSAVYYNGLLYICGFATKVTTNPTLLSSKVAMMVSVNLNTYANTERYANTTAIPSNFMDYDVYTRLRVINNNLFVVGSKNRNVPFAGGNYKESFSYIALMHPTALIPLAYAAFGDPFVALPAGSDNSPYGTFALDVAPLPNGNLRILSHIYNHGAYGLSSGVYDSWCVNDATFNGLTITVNPTAYYFANSSGMKPYGLTVLSDGKTSVYGLYNHFFHTWTNNPNNNDLNGTPFVFNFTTPSVGASVQSTLNYTTFGTGIVTGNQPTNAQYYGDEGFWNNSLPEWSLTDFACKGDIDATTYAGPINYAPGLMMAAHHQMSSGWQPGNAIGVKILHTDETGLTTCSSLKQAFTCSSFTMSVGTQIVLPYGPTNNSVNPAFAVSQISIPDNNICPDALIGFFPSPGVQIPLPRYAQKVAISIQELYPNPATNVLHIKATGINIDDQLTLTLTDAMGKVVFNGLATNEAIPTVNLPYLSSGFYTATVSVNNAPTQNFKLTIQ